MLQLDLSGWIKEDLETHSHPLSILGKIFHGKGTSISHEQKDLVDMYHLTFTEVLPRISEWRGYKYGRHGQEFCNWESEQDFIDKEIKPRLGPFFELAKYLEDPEKGKQELHDQIEAAKSKGSPKGNSNKRLPEAKINAVLRADLLNPGASDRQIARETGVSQPTVGKIRTDAKTDNIKCDSVTFDIITEKPVQKPIRGTNGKGHTIARLKRDGHADLAKQVESGKLSARKARFQVGYEKPKITVTWNQDAQIEEIAGRIIEKLDQDQINALFRFFRDELVSD